MLGMILVLASQPIPEVTPTINSLTISTGGTGTCLTHPLQPATISVAWTVTGFNSVTQDYKLYRDGILVSTTDVSPYGLQITGLVENDTHNVSSITFNYRLDVVRTSDGVVLATRSASTTKSYGNCV